MEARAYGDAARRRSRGVVLHYPVPLCRRRDQQQPTKQVTCSRDRLPVPSLVVKDALYYHNQHHPGAPVKDNVQVLLQSRRQNAGRHPDAAGGFASTITIREGRRAFVGEDRHCAHPMTYYEREDRNASTSSSAQPFHFGEWRTTLRIRVRDHAPQSQIAAWREVTGRLAAPGQMFGRRISGRRRPPGRAFNVPVAADCSADAEVPRPSVLTWY